MTYLSISSPVNASVLVSTHYSRQIVCVNIQVSRSYGKWQGNWPRVNIVFEEPNTLQSSLTLSLLRCIFTEGNVYYDGKLTSSINLDALRSSITIIPQTVRV